MSAPDARAAAAQREPARGALALRLFACFAAGYFMSYGLRSIHAVLAPELLADLGLTHAQLGSLSAAYFLAFAALQVPLGVWLDRYGPRRVDAALMAVAAVGCAVFALGTSFATLWIGRALIGVGVSAALMASYAAFRTWFAPTHQTRLAAWIMTAGTAGVLVATVPVHHALPVLGWRGVFWVAAAAFAAIGATMWWALPRDREPSGRGALTFAASLAGYREVFRDPWFRRWALTAGVGQGGFVAMQSLWVGPWLDRVLGIGGAALAERLFVFNLGLLLAFLALGWLAPRVPADRGALLRVVGAGMVLVVAAEVAIAFASGPSAWWLWLVFGAAATVYTLVQPRVALGFPPHLAGRALTSYNLLLFTWMFVSQWGFGVAVDELRVAGLSEADAFRAALLGLAGLHAACAAPLLVWARVARPQVPQKVR